MCTRIIVARKLDFKSVGTNTCCLLLVSMLFSATLVQGYTEDDVKECGNLQFDSVTCTSLQDFYSECPVIGARRIFLIKLHRNLTAARCEFKSTFGFRETSVWVTNGCSGIFYLCYDGDALSTVNPPVTPPTPGGNDDKDDVASATTAASGNDVYIYIIVGCCVALLVGVGFVVGCVLKRRQQKDSSRHLAEKRQIRIARREHMQDREENGASPLPLCNRSLSIESLRTIDPNDYDVRSIYSSMSSISSVTQAPVNVSNKMIPRGSVRSVSYQPPGGRLKKGYSTPDIHALGRMFCEVNMLNRQQRNSVTRASQRSINSVSSRQSAYETALERRLRQQARRTERFTSGFYGTCADRALRGSTRSTRTLPSNRAYTRAMVHSNSPSLEEQFARQASFKSMRSMRFSLEHDPMTIHEHPDVDSTTRPLTKPSTSRSSEQVASMNHEFERPTSETHEQTRKEPPQTSFSKNSYTSQHEPHYHDPNSLKLGRHSIRGSVVKVPPRPITPEVKIQSMQEKVYSKVTKPRILHPKPRLNKDNIYASVNKSTFKAVIQAETSHLTEGKPSCIENSDDKVKNIEYEPDIYASPSEVICDSKRLKEPETEEGLSGIENYGLADITTLDVYLSTYDVVDLEDDEEDVVASSNSKQEKDMYARLATFKPVASLAPYYVQGASK